VSASETPLRIVLHVPFGADALAKLATGRGCDVVRPADAAGIAREAENADALWISPTVYDAKLIETVERHPRVRWIQLASMGYDAVEDAGAPRGVVVANAGNAYAPMVAEHALALALALFRQIPAALEHQHAKHWFRKTNLTVIRSLYRSTVGIYGFGHIGREIAARFAACGATIVAIAPDAKVGGDVAKAFPATALHEALGLCDVVVLAAPLTAETKGAFDAAAFAAMKPDAIVVNIARGQIVDEPALVAALAAGTLGGAALDVTEPEPPDANDPIWTTKNVLLTAHVAAFSHGTLDDRLAEVIAENLVAFLAGDEIPTAVPLSDLKRARRASYAYAGRRTP